MLPRLAPQIRRERSNSHKNCYAMYYSCYVAWSRDGQENCQSDSACNRKKGYCAERFGGPSFCLSELSKIRGNGPFPDFSSRLSGRVRGFIGVFFCHFDLVGCLFSAIDRPS